MAIMDRRVTRLLLLPVLLLLSACGGAATNLGAAPAETIAQQTALADADLVGSVGPGFTIELTRDGSDVTELKAGSYSLSVVDAAATHNFALKGPNGTVTQITDVPFTGTKTATVVLTPGLWTFFCQPHSTQMTGSFTVS